MTSGCRLTKPATTVSCEVVSSHTKLKREVKQVVKKIWLRMEVVYCRKSFCWNVLVNPSNPRYTNMQEGH
jgi:hypothetical protein